ncbi:MAG: Hsp20/alpha crystallin family protein [Roseiarcus sp.]
MRVTVPTLWGRDLNPFEGFRREFDDLWRDFGTKFPMPWTTGGETVDVAPLNVAETKEAVEIATELPGMGENEVTVTIEGQSIVIAGEKKTETETTDKAWQVVERSYGSFRRVVPLTFAPDPSKINATFEKGILHVTVAKPAEMIERKVTIPIQKAT